MSRFRRLPLLALALAVWFGLGVVVASATAADMTHKMTMSTSVDGAGDDCPACGAAGGKTADAECAPYCHLANSAVIAPVVACLSTCGADFGSGSESPPAGIVVAFDPSPPKPSEHS